MTNAVDVRDAFRIYGSGTSAVAALQGLMVEIERGEIVVVLGPSGSGKTTLLKTLAGLDHVSAGVVRVLDVELASQSERALARFRAANVGILDQHYARALSPELTCRQSVALQLELLGHDRARSHRAAEQLLERVGLGDRADARPAELSGGEQQRVALCSAVAHRPRLLLADEPAGELDASNARLVYGLLGELVRGAGATAVIVSHDAAATEIADRAVHVRDGRIVEETAGDNDPRLVVSHGWVRLPDPLLRRVAEPTRLRAQDHPDGLLLAAERAPVQLRERVAPTTRVSDRNGEPVAELRAVSKRFGDRIVFADVSARFTAGTFTAVVGRSGTGKTTLLHLLAGLERPTSGDVLVGGSALVGRTRTELAAIRRTQVGLVTQDPGLVPYLSARENVVLGLQLRGADLDTRADDALAAVGLTHRADQRAAVLSAGERERVAIARALAARTSLLLVDEPTARLDGENAALVAQLIAAAAHERGVAVICATHDAAVIELADDELDLGAQAAVLACPPQHAEPSGAQQP